MRINQFMLRTLFAMASAFFSTGFVSTALFTSSLVSAGLFSNDARAHTNEYLDTLDGEQAEAFGVVKGHGRRPVLWSCAR